MAEATPTALRVLQVSAFFPSHGGGIEIVAGALADRLGGPGLHVHWLASGRPEHAPAQRPGLTAEAVRAWDPLEAHIGLPMPLWGPTGLWRLWKAVGAADLVHVHDYLYQPTLATLLFAALRRRPVVITQHVGEIPFRSARARALLSLLNRHLGAPLLARAARAIFVGAPVKDYFTGLTPFARTPRLIPNGVDLERFHDRPREEAGLRSDRVLRLLFVGRFVEKKGGHLLRQCLDLPGCHWTFVGWGPMPPADGDSATVRLAGRLPPQEIVGEYQAADLLVLPSVGEGFPLVVQEALACGTPVLVSRDVAQAFPARDPRCVFEVDLGGPDPAAALRAALRSLTADPTALHAAREPARALAQQWSWERCAQAYREVYRQAVSSGT